LLNNLVQYLLFIAMIDLFKTYGTVATLIYNAIVIFIIYLWIKIKLKLLIFPTPSPHGTMGVAQPGLRSPTAPLLGAS
jgi:hypothetical protein